jgi:hypothetical protein
MAVPALHTALLAVGLRQVTAAEAHGVCRYTYTGKEVPCAVLEQHHFKTSSGGVWRSKNLDCDRDSIMVGRMDNGDVRLVYEHHSADYVYKEKRR